MLKRWARRIAPRPLWRWLRAWKLRRSLARFQPYLVEHDYAGVRLKVYIADPLAEGWYDHPWEPLPEVDLLRAAGLVAGARVFDIGAHQGIVAMILAHHVGEGGEVIAVEALPHNAELCTINCEANGLQQIRVEAAAISDRPGTLRIAPDLNSHVEDDSRVTAAGSVPAVTVDGLAEKYGLPDVLFIDVEGYECQALRGGARVLSRAPDCYVEVHRGHGLEAAGGSLAEVFSFFPTDRYTLHAWSDSDALPREIACHGDCPEGGRVFLVAIGRRR